MAQEQQDNRVGGSNPGSGHSVLLLGADCTIREAATLKQQLLQHLDRAEPLFVDGSCVEKADAAGVQLLVAFALDCMERGIAFGWPGRSAALEHAIKALGVAALLECPGEVALPPAAHRCTTGPRNR
jgi:anti-anti-sigma regulatory factor